MSLADEGIRGARTKKNWVKGMEQQALTLDSWYSGLLLFPSIFWGSS